MTDVAESLDSIAQSLATPPAPVREVAPTMGNVARINYSHDGMIDLIIAQPGLSQNQIAAKMGYTPSWISNVMASDAFQSRLAQRREEVVDPVLKAGLEERMRGLVSRSLEVIGRKLDQPQVSDMVALKALELGAKALGIGGNAPPRPEPVNLDVLAQRLMALNAPRIVDGNATRVEDQ